MSDTPKSDEVMTRWWNNLATVHDVIRVSRSLEHELIASKRKLDIEKSEKLKVVAISKSLVEEAQRKLASAEERVKELEGLAIGNECREDSGAWIEVFIPVERLGGANCEGEESPTLDDAMPRKEP